MIAKTEVNSVDGHLQTIAWICLCVAVRRKHNISYIVVYCYQLPLSVTADWFFAYIKSSSEWDKANAGPTKPLQAWPVTTDSTLLPVFPKIFLLFSQI